MKIIQLLKRKRKADIQKIEDKVIRVVPTEQVAIIVDRDDNVGARLIGSEGEKLTREQLCLLRNIQPAIKSICDMKAECEAAIQYGVPRHIAYKWYGAYMENVRYAICEVDGTPKLFNGATVDNAVHRLRAIERSLSSRLAVEARYVSLKLYV